MNANTVAVFCNNSPFLAQLTLLSSETDGFRNGHTAKINDNSKITVYHANTNNSPISTSFLIVNGLPSHTIFTHYYHCSSKIATNDKNSNNNPSYLYSFVK